MWHPCDAMALPGTMAAAATVQPRRRSLVFIRTPIRRRVGTQRRRPPVGRYACYGGRTTVLAQGRTRVLAPVHSGSGCSSASTRPSNSSRLRESPSRLRQTCSCSSVARSSSISSGHSSSTRRIASRSGTSSATIGLRGRRRARAVRRCRRARLRGGCRRAGRTVLSATGIPASHITRDRTHVRVLALEIGSKLREPATICHPLKSPSVFLTVWPSPNLGAALSHSASRSR